MSNNPNLNSLPLRVALATITALATPALAGCTQHEPTPDIACYQMQLDNTQPDVNKPIIGTQDAAHNFLTYFLGVNKGSIKRFKGLDATTKEASETIAKTHDGMSVYPTDTMGIQVTLYDKSDPQLGGTVEPCKGTNGYRLPQNVPKKFRNLDKVNPNGVFRIDPSGKSSVILPLER